MKYILLTLFVFIILFTGCDDNGNDNSNNITSKNTLKITNLSTYELFNVEYTSVNFGNLSVGSDKSMPVDENGFAPIFFELSVNNNRVRCRTDEMIRGNEGERIISNTWVITTVVGGINGSISHVYSALSKPIFELSQGSTKINNDEPLPFDFGRIEISTSKQFVFTIKNLGNLPLELNGSPVILSSNPVFSITSQPTNSSINPEASAAFIVLYSPTFEREDTGTITILNNSDDLIFTLKVKGVGFIPVPQISVKQGSETINPAGEYDFGGVVSGSTKDVSFIIGNIGGAELTFTTVNGNRINISENTSNAFSIVQQPSTAVIPGSSTNFLIRFAPASSGSNYSANIRIITNSRDNDEFVITLKGSCYDVISVAPTGINAAAQSSSSIRVSWNPSSGATYYKVYYGTSSSSITILASDTVTEAFFNHTGLQPNTIYYYRVAATNSAGDSGYSTSTSARTKLETPTGIFASPYSLTISNTITWGPVTGATSYKIYSGTSNTTVTTLLSTITGTTFYHHSNNGARGGTLYYYRVVAYNNSAGDSDYSSIVSALTLPEPPTNIRATPQTSTSIRVSWNASTGATSYIIYYYNAETMDDIIVRTSITTETSVTITGLKTGVQHGFYVIAKNDTGESGKSEYAFATPQ